MAQILASAGLTIGPAGAPRRTGGTVRPRRGGPAGTRVDGRIWERLVFASHCIAQAPSLLSLAFAIPCALRSARCTPPETQRASRAYGETSEERRLRIATARDVGGAVREGSPERGEPTDLRRAERTSAATLQLGALYQEFAPRLVRTAQRLTRDVLAAEDVVQTAFEKTLRHVADFRGDARLSTWLHRIVTNEALVWLRTEHRRARHLQHDAESVHLEARDPAPQAPEVLQLRERAARVREGLGRLGIPEREVLLRVFMEDQNYATIATQTAEHRGAIKTRAFRARRRLRMLLAEP